jgi:translocation and assembly module TamB
MDLLRPLARVAGCVVVFALAAGGGALAHRNLPAVRRAVVARVNAALVSAVPGRIRIEQIGSLGLDRVAGVSVAITDPDGATVLHVRDLAARIDVARLLGSLRSGGPIEIDLPSVSAAAVDVNLDPGPNGALRIASAFVPDTPSPPSTSSASARGVHLQVRDVQLDRVTVRGSPVPSLPLDVDMDGVLVALEVAPGALLLDRVHAAVTARGMPPGSVTHGIVDARFEQPSRRGGEHAVDLTWTGTVGAIPTSASAMLEGDAVFAVIDAPAIQPADLAALWPASPLTEAAGAHVEVVGLLPLARVSVRATAGPGTLRAEGPVVISGTRRAALRFQASSIDAHAFSAGAPRTKLDASGDALFAMNASGALGGVAAMGFSGTAGPTVVPATELTADFAREAPPHAMNAHARLVVSEPGAPSTIDASVAPKGTGLEVAFDASVLVPDLDHVLRLGPIAQGSARLSAHGHFDTTTQRVDANVSARANHVAAGPVTLDSLALDARATGPLTTPDLDGEIRGQDLEVAGVSISHLHAGIHGPASGAEVSLRLGNEGTHLQAKATVAMIGAGAGASVRDLHVIAENGSETARLDASHIVVTAREQRLEEAEIKGFGAPLHLTAEATPGTLTVRTRSHAIDLARIARFAGLAIPVKGRVALDVDATLHRTEGEGHVTFDATEASLGPIGDSEGHVDLTLTGRNLTGMVSARVGDVGTLSLQPKSLQIGGTAPLGASSWRALFGEVDLQGHVDLATLAKQLPATSLPVSRIGGALDLDGHLARDSASDASPEIALSAATKGLVATGPASAPWTLQGTDLQAEVKVDGANAHTTISARAVDGHGLLASLTAASDAVPYARITARDEPLLALLRGVAFTGNVEIPGRELADFPAVMGTRGVHGQLGGTLAWQGSLDRPTVDVQATLARGGAAAKVLSGTLDLALTGHYDGERLDADLTASERSQPLLDAAAQLDVSAADLLVQATTAGVPLPWKASTQVKLTRFPLQSLAALDDRQVRGHLSGDFSITGLHDDAHATLDLSASDFSVGDMACKSATMKATIDGHALDAQTRIDESDGTMQALAHAGTHWGAAMTPSMDVAQTADVTVTAKNFRVDLIQPLVETVFAELDGRLDADVKIHADPARRLLQPQGSVHLTGGVVEVAGFGGEFHDATAEIDLTPDGVVKLQKMSAMGLSGKVEAAASARFDGLAFAGARANLQVQRQQPLPLVVDGVQVGTFDGQLGLAVDPIAAAKGGGYAVKVDVPQMQLQLPTQTARTVQSLGSLGDVSVGTQRPGKGFVPLRLDGPTQKAAAGGAAQSPLRVTVALGQNVVVKRGTQLQVYLGGSPTITVANDVKATGQVKLLHGSLDVQGKTFTIESGTVTFVDDPTNPQVVLEASWPAPDGTTIYADFIGPLKTGKVTLRADPPRPQDEILSLILFGTTDEQTPSSSGTTAQGSSAVGAAGGAATAPINQALGGVNQMLDNFGLAGGISTRVDTSQATPRPEVEIQIARDLSVQVAWVLGVPPPGSNPDTTLFTLDWRFLRSWSLETTVGDAGTSILDLVWQHRY